MTEFETGDRVALPSVVYDSDHAPTGTVVGFAHGDRVEVEWDDDEPTSREHRHQLELIEGRESADTDPEGGFLMLYAGMAEEILKEQGYWDDGWRVDNEAVLTCPHGHQIEYDGDCFEGCESPFKQMGVI